MSEDTNLGSRIRQRRVAARLSQEELADSAGINRTYLSQLENGHSSPTMEVLNKLARALRVDPARLISAAPIWDEAAPSLGEAASRYSYTPEEPTYSGLQEFLEDERIRLLINPSPEEIELLKGTRFLNRFSPSKELFVEILLDYRRRGK